MKFDNKEKHFWKSNFNVGNPAAIPLEKARPAGTRPNKN